MKNVLVLAPDFVPSSAPPALRLRFLMSHLREFGWDPIVLSVDPSRYEHPVDPENECLLPGDIEVIRASAAAASVTRKFGVGDLGLRSLRPMWKALCGICEERRIDLIFSSVPPYPTMVLARRAYDRFRIPYVIDYQDPWVTDYYAGRPKHERPPKWRWFHAMASRAEPFALKRVAHITGVSSGTTELVRERYPFLGDVGSTEIPIGVEPADFDYVRRHSRPNRMFDPKDGLVHVCYVGVCIPGMHQAIRALFDAVRRGRGEAPETFSRLRLHFIGTTYAQSAVEQVMPIAREAKIADIVSEHPARIPYLDAVQMLLDSSAVLLFGSDAPHYTASKLFPCVQAQKPLLAIFHRESTVVSIAAETRAGTVFTFDNHGDSPAARVRDIQAWLAMLLTSSQQLQPRTDWKAFENYTARAMAGRLCGVFDRVTECKQELVAVGARMEV